MSENVRISCRPHALYYERDRWIKLDSLLLKAVLQEQYGEAFQALPPISPTTPTEALGYPNAMPLERRERLGVWYYACSWADVEAATIRVFAMSYVRHFSEELFRRYGTGKGREVIHAGKGVDKLVCERVRLRLVSGLVWYAVGDQAEIKRLLETYYHSVGKKESQGHGQLIPYPDGSLWKVEAVEYDYSERDADGRATRGLPSEHGVRYPVRPPYYVRANVAELELPPR